MGWEEAHTPIYHTPPPPELAHIDSFAHRLYYLKIIPDCAAKLHQGLVDSVMG